MPRGRDTQSWVTRSRLVRAREEAALNYISKSGIEPQAQLAQMPAFQCRLNDFRVNIREETCFATEWSWTGVRSGDAAGIANCIWCFDEGRRRFPVPVFVRGRKTAVNLGHEGRRCWHSSGHRHRPTYFPNFPNSATVNFPQSNPNKSTFVCRSRVRDRDPRNPGSPPSGPGSPTFPDFAVGTCQTANCRERFCCTKMTNLVLASRRSRVPDSRLYATTPVSYQRNLACQVRRHRSTYTLNTVSDYVILAARKRFSIINKSCNRISSISGSSILVNPLHSTICPTPTILSLKYYFY